MEIGAASGSDPVARPLEGSGAGVKADLELIQAAIERERLAREAASKFASTRINYLEEALLAANQRAAEQTEAIEAAGRRRRWLGAAALLIGAGLLVRAVLHDQPDASPPGVPPVRTEFLKPQPASPADSPLRQLALLPSKRASADRASPETNGPLAIAAGQLDSALALHPQSAWSGILDHIRQTRGREVCPFLWIKDNFVFILPEAPAGIRSLPAALQSCADAVNAAK